MRRVLLIPLAATLACGGSDNVTTPLPSRGVRIVAGANVTDTVSAALSQALTVEVRDSTSAIVPVGTVVRFNSVARGPSSGVEVMVQPLAGPSYTTFASSTTDASGRASVILKFGIYAGPGRVAITVPVLGVTDTARFTIAAGNFVRVVVAPIDTLVTIGKSFTYRGGAVDQYGNVRTDPLTWTVSGGGATVSSAGAVSATALGRYTVITTSGTHKDTSFVSAVPRGRLAATQFNAAGFGYAVTAMDIDGSNVKALATAVDGGIGVGPVWTPDGKAVVYSTLLNGIQTLFIADTAGTSRPFFDAGIPNVTHQAEPNFSRDGKWLYFSAYDTRCSLGSYCLYRSRADGTQPELLGSLATTNNILRPAPSPDGSRVAFLAGYYGSYSIKVLDVATKVVASWSVPGMYPSWSPDGSEIAFISSNDQLQALRADGSSTRTLSTLAHGYQKAPVTWTTDGKYLLARSLSNTYDLVDVQSGAYVPLKYSGSFFLLSLAP